MSPVTNSQVGLVCQDDFQPGFNTNDHNMNGLDHLFPAIRWLIFCTYEAGWVTLPPPTSYLEGKTFDFFTGYCVQKRNLMLARLAGLVR